MQKLFIETIIILTLFLYGKSSFANDPFQNSSAVPPDMTLDKALENIAANKQFLISFKENFGESWVVPWGTPIADKLPTQTLAVIQIITETGIPVNSMCPKMFLEDSTTFDQYKAWMQNSITALEAFTASDPKDEATRQSCLHEIQNALQNKEVWQ